LPAFACFCLLFAWGCLVLPGQNQAITWIALLGSSGFIAPMSKHTSKIKIALPAEVAGLSPLELNRKIPIADAAQHNGVTTETFKRSIATFAARSAIGVCLLPSTTRSRCRRQRRRLTLPNKAALQA
jgi:hypothetical protein